MSNENKAPRRFNLQLLTPAERAIHDAVIEVEKLPADARRTRAVMLLVDAKNLIGDVVEK